MKKTYDMERSAVMPMSAHVGAVLHGIPLALSEPVPVTCSAGMTIPTSSKPWTSRFDRSRLLQNRLQTKATNGRRTRRLGSSST